MPGILTLFLIGSGFIIAFIGAIIYYASKSIGDSTSFETTVEDACITAEQQHGQAFSELPEVADVDELIRDTHNAVSIDGNTPSVSIQSNVSSLNGDEGHSGGGDEKPIEASAPTGSDEEPEADKPDKSSGTTDGSGGSSADDTNLGRAVGS